MRNPIVASSQNDIRDRLRLLRDQLRKHRLDGLLVPREDEHIGHFIALPPSAERLRWISGFSGSAGTAVILPTKAALFVDGRYFLRARLEVPSKEFDVFQVPQDPLDEWLAKHLKQGARLALDPRLHTADEVRLLQQKLLQHGIKLTRLRRNLIDLLWNDRPENPSHRLRLHPTRLAGASPQMKLDALQKSLRSERDDAVILTLPDSVSWLFNLRASDIEYAPVVLAFAILYKDRLADFFVSGDRVDGNLIDHLSSVANIKAPDELATAIRALGKEKARVRIDRATASDWFVQKLKAAGAAPHYAPDPCRLPKARKNATEIKGSRAAHLRDGVALVRFLAWLDTSAKIDELDELAIVQKLDSFRQSSEEYRGNPFPTICGAGPNGAIIHYRVSKMTSRRLGRGELLLLDSGGQYIDGTTDVTRTIAIGEPTIEMRENFTLVLKGHIAIASSRFPKGTRGVDLDPFARRMLWQAGHDFDHGTGHGVGSYLSVHEGPQTISRMGMTVFEPGMIVSNEPGFYKEGSYGIRIENLVLVTPAEKISGGDRQMMGFETLTLVPIDLKLLAPKMLSFDEVAWLNEYHRCVHEAIAPQLQKSERDWLVSATRAISC